MARTANSVKNGVVSILVSSITIVLGLIFQAVFVKTLGVEYLGIKGLMTNILSILALAELGFGSAIVYHLYKPLSDNDSDMVRGLTVYYKKIYRIVAAVVMLSGLVVLPFVPHIVGEVTITYSLYLIFMLYLLDSVCSYFLTYKRSILYADQKNYIISIISIICSVVLNVLQIVFLLLTKDFVVYLIIKIIFRIVENVAISTYVNKKYPYLKKLNGVEPLPKEVTDDIKLKVKGLLFHKVGGYVLSGTDNIVISMTKGLGIITVGLYSNYCMIITYVTNLFGNIFYSLTASVGNLLVEGDTEKSLRIYKSMTLLNAWIMGFCAISIFCLMEPVVTIWLGAEYVLPTTVLFVVTLNFYVQAMRKTTSTFKEAAGIFYEDKFVPIIEAILNIVFSVILAQMFGLAGVIIGTMLSTSIVYLYSYPVFVYKRVLKGTYFDYIKLLAGHALIFFIVWGITYAVVKFCTVDNTLLQILINGAICAIIPNVLFLLVYRKSKYFEYYKVNIIDKFLNKFLKRGRKTEQ